MYMPRQSTVLRRNSLEEGISRNQQNAVRGIFGIQIFLFLMTSLSACGIPYRHFEYLASYRWGIILPVPEETTVIQKGNVTYFLSNHRDWTLTLSVWKDVTERDAIFSEREERFRFLLIEAKKWVDEGSKSRWIEGGLSWLGGGRGLRIEFEALPEKGQASIYFEPGDPVFHRMVFLEVNRRLYQIHMQSLISAKNEAIKVWNEIAEETRLSGKPLVEIPLGRILPESEMDSIIRQALAKENIRGG